MQSVKSLSFYAWFFATDDKRLSTYGADNATANAPRVFARIEINLSFRCFYINLEYFYFVDVPDIEGCFPDTL